MFNKLLVLLLVAYFCTVKSAVGTMASGVSMAPPIGGCDNDDQGREVCTTFEPLGLQCYLQKKNGDLFESQLVSLVENSGNTLGGGAPISPVREREPTPEERQPIPVPTRPGIVLTPNERNTEYVQGICGSFGRVKTCYE